MKQIKSTQKKRSSKTTYEKEYLQMKKEKVFLCDILALLLIF